MRNIPLFTTQNGAACLFLDQIPYSGMAYIRLYATQEPQALLEECISFCRACGASAGAAMGHPCLAAQPVYLTLLEMRAACMPGSFKTDPVFPVTEKTAGRWREIYNERMAGVPGARQMAWTEEKSLAKSGCCFVHEGNELLGIGKVTGQKIEAVAACRPGAGERVLKALLELVTGDQAVIEVAQENERAVRLYERLGFLKTGVLETWYKIF